jgi:hypothetical protein
MTLDDLVEALNVDHDNERFRAVLNSALWRRKDLFKRENGKYDLQTTDFILV